MRTTINVDDAILAWAKDRAHAEKRTLGDVIESSLRLYLIRDGAPATTTSVSLPVSKRSGGARPGIDLSSNRSMFEAMDDEERAEQSA